MPVLVDSSVWVAHFKRTNDVLCQILLENNVLIHPLIIGEISCDTPPKPRAVTLSNLSKLSASERPRYDEVMSFIEREKLYGQGYGWIDINLLCATLMTSGATLWTLDEPLAKLAARFDVDFSLG